MVGVIQQSINKDDPFSEVSGYEAERIELDPATETVEGRVQSIIDRSGPALQSEVTRAKQGAAQRGLLNTSMALGAAERARYDYATPIATQDAQNILQSKVANQAATSQASQFTAGELNKAAGQERAGQQDLDRLGAQSEADIAKVERVAELERGRDIMMNQHAENMQQMAAEDAMALEEVRAQNQQLIQATNSAGLIFSQTSASIGEILADPHIPEYQKNSLIRKETELLESALAVLQGMTGVDTTSLLTFGGDAGVTGAPNPATFTGAFGGTGPGTGAGTGGTGAPGGGGRSGGRGGRGNNR